MAFTTTTGRRIPTDIKKLVGRPWEGDSDRVVQEMLQDIADCTQGMPFLPLTTKGDILVFGSAPVRLPVGTDGYFLRADSTKTLGLTWSDIGTDQNILANQIFGG